MALQEPSKDKRKPRGQWSKGESGNPAGGPAGSRNKATLWLEELLEGEGDAITRKAIELALRGDPNALRLCLERIYPTRKERLIDLPLPDVQTAQDARAALSLILNAVGKGQITPGEGETLTVIVESQNQAIQAKDWENRLIELEKSAKKGKGGRP
jgi:hypothetical protein